jgi:tetratricopeptide (TPR) repeat protein
MNGRFDRIRVIESAEKYVKAGKLKEAVSEYQKLLEGDAQDFAISNIIGDLYVRLGQNEKAAKSFQNVADEYERRGLYSQALAVFKKIAKIKPEDPDLSIKLADIYSLQGFAGEAKKEYLKTAEQFLKSKRSLEAIRVYEKVVKLEKDDLDAKMILAGLYKDEGFKDAAAEQLDDIAELKLGQGNPDEAEKMLLEAKDISPSHLRTLLGLVEVLKRGDQRKKAVDLIEGALKEDVENPTLLNLLGNFAFEEGNFSKAEEIFALIVKAHPMNVNARIKLGRIYIQKESLDQAFDLYEPLVSSLIKKQKEEKAIGLLGLILAAHKSHLPSLDKLSSIYRSGKNFAKLEVVDRVILDEMSRQGLMDKALTTLAELVKIRPDDTDLLKEHAALRKDLGLPEEDREDSWAVSVKDREAIQQTLEQADLYIQQGLVRNARRILENLRMKYSDDPQIMQKIAVLDEIRSQMSEEEIRVRVEKAQAMESKAREKGSRAVLETEKKEAPPKGKPAPPSHFSKDVVDEEKISTADIFAETDIIPFISPESGEKKYFNLRDRIEEEARMIEAIHFQQAMGGTTQLEKELSVIVSDFKKGLNEKVPAEDYEVHYQLGIAFMEQGLFSEAIEELTVASKDKVRAMECYSIISQCFRNRKNLAEAERWLNKAVLMAKEGTEAYFALTYDRAILSEEAQETDKALSLFKEIQTWNPAYRGISDKVTSLEKEGS